MLAGFSSCPYAACSYVVLFVEFVSHSFDTAGFHLQATYRKGVKTFVFLQGEDVIEQE